MHSSRSWLMAVVVLGSNLLSGQVVIPQARITERIVESELVTLHGNTHPLARQQFERGEAPSNLPLERMLLVFSRSNEQQTNLDALIEKLHDPNSQYFHQWLNPEQFGERFGVSEADLTAVTSWLESHGFQVDSVPKGRTILEFSGTASQVEEAFHTRIHKYNVDGEDHWANASDPQIPKALSPVVAGVATLHNFVKQSQIRRTTENEIPQFTSSQGIHYLSPADFAVIYNVSPLYQAGINGSGRSIAVVARSNINVSDINQFRSLLGLPSNPPQIILNGVNPGLTGAEDEAVLDVSWAGAAAPGATIKLVVTRSTNTSDGVDLSAAYIVNNNLADVMTESFGSCEAQRTSSEATMFASIAAQAAAQGITYLVSSGDEGSAGCDSASSATATGPVSVNILASNPYVIAVGGTQFNASGGNYWSSSNTSVNGSALSYIPENVWNASCSIAQCGSARARLASSGGGASIYYSKPGWQNGVPGIPADGARDIPDVSLTASSSIAPYLVCLDGSCSSGLGSNPTAIGGTSASAPSFAGIMALIGQKTNSRQGQANFRLYQLAATQDPGQCNSSLVNASASCIFHDVTVGNNAVPGQAGYGTINPQYQAGFGYDQATGLGSVNVANLVNGWNTVPAPTGSRALGVSASSLNFKSVQIGAAFTQAVTLVNEGSATITISSIIVAVNGGNAFTQTNNCPGTLVGSGTCSITITFLPRTAGALSGSLSITDNAPGSPHTVALSGSGVVGSTLSLLPSSFAFGSQKLQSRSQARVLQIANSTSSIVTVTGVAVSGANILDFQAANTCKPSLGPGGNCLVYVVFTPQLAGTRSATLTISSSLLGSALTVPLTGTGVISGGFQIVNSKSGKVLDLPSGSSGNGAFIQQSLLNGQLQQQWLFNPTGNGYFYIVNAMSGKALDDTGASLSNGTLVQQYDYLGQANQQWQLTAVDDVHYRIINRLSGKALDLPGGSSAVGTVIQQWDINEVPQQLWALMPVSSYSLLNSASSASLDVPGGSGANGTVVQQYGGNGYRQQQWQLLPTGSGYYAFLNRSTGKVLDVAGASSRNGALVQEYDFLGGFNQQWQIVQIDSTRCEILNRLSGKVLDVPGSSIANGAQIQQWDYLGNSNQQWQLLPVTLYSIVNRASGKVLEVPGGSLTNGSLIQQASATGAQQQRWQLLSTGGGSFAMLNDLTGKVLDVTGTSLANGALIQQYDYRGSTNQQWEPLSLFGGYFALMNRGSAKALDVIGGSTAAGAMLQQYTFLGGANQQWSLVEISQ